MQIALEDYLKKDQKPAFEANLLKLCFRYNELKRELWYDDKYKS